MNKANIKDDNNQSAFIPASEHAETDTSNVNLMDVAVDLTLTKDIPVSLPVSIPPPPPELKYVEEKLLTEKVNIPDLNQKDTNTKIEILPETNKPDETIELDECKSKDNNDDSFINDNSNNVLLQTETMNESKLNKYTT